MVSITIIIPVYNAEKTLSRCLYSIVNQSFRSFEIICVDDGSTDGSLEICKDFASQDNRIHIINKENGGVSSARNVGLREATGSFISFVDADDELRDDALLLLVNSFSEGIDLVMGGYVILNQQTETVYSITQREYYVFDRESALKQMYHSSPYKYLGYVWGKVFKKEIIKSHNLCFDETLYYNEDRLFVTNYICFCNKIVHFTEPIYNYYETESSAMNSLCKGFNRKFLTDLDGYIKMKDCIVNSVNSSLLLEMTNIGIFSSFHRIMEMMAQHHSKSLKIIILLHWKLIRSVGTREYLRFIIKTINEKLNSI